MKTLMGTMRFTVSGAVMFALLAVGTVSADGRTALKPGWNMFSPQQDVEVGQQVAPDAERQLAMLKNARADDYVNNLGRRLAAKAPGEKFPYRFKVVNDQAINAFALPGGPVYINRGVIEAADNESQLAGVIAHEIAHVSLRHGTNQASKASAAQVPLAVLGGMIGSDSTKAVLTQLGASFAVNSILLKYSRSAESQADIMGTQILYDAGYDPRAMGQFFEKIEDQQKGNGPVEFFSNHPSPENRIERVGQEVNALGGTGRDAITDSKDFDQIKRSLRSMPRPPARSQLQASDDRRQPVASGLYIVSASYGAGSRFTDVRQRLQSSVQNDRLDLRVDNSSMGGDSAEGDDKTLRVRYQWSGRQYDVAVDENKRLYIPTNQQARDAGEGSSEADSGSERFVRAENSLLRIDHPQSWQVHGMGDAMTIAPRGGLVSDGQGSQALMTGVIVNVFEPRGIAYGQQLQGPNGGQSARQDAATHLEQSTDQLIQELRLSNRNMRVIRYREAITVDDERGLSTYLSNDSPGGGRETDWVITVDHPEGLLFLVFTAQEREFQGHEGTFHEILRSVRIKR